MNTKKYILSFLLLATVTFGFAQQITVEDTTYEVRGEAILKDGVDVTKELSEDNKAMILTKHAELQKSENALVLAKKEEQKEIKRAEKAEKKELRRIKKEERNRKKELKKQQKALKKAEKKQKQAEKALKKQAKAHKRLTKAKSKLESSQKKYERLQSRGKLSPKGEAKWLKRLEKLNDNVVKANRNFSKS